jgi:1-phosphofructokinase
VIITVTLNPGLDLTYTLTEDAADVDVHRAVRSTLEASGKGVNISRALARVGMPTVAVLPAGGPTGRYLVELLDDEAVAHRVTPQAGQTRVNTTALRPAGVTVKLNGPGAALTPAEQEHLLHQTDRALEDSRRGTADPVWLAVCGSLPPGVDASLVEHLVERAHAHGARCAVDTSGAALAAALSSHADLVAPNRRELSEVTDTVGAEGPLEQFAETARQLAKTTKAELLVSLGRDGALYTDGDQVLHGYGPPLNPVNTAGAGDALLAGWLSSDTPARSRLARAIGWSRSACLAPTTVDDTPGQRDAALVTVLDVAQKSLA